VTSQDRPRWIDRATRRGRGTGDRGATFAQGGPSLPERLVAAREQKGVDLFRAERDTKIRVRYLAALERGEYQELPGAVYTKGFLRNYAAYLGLDPEDVLRQWRRERGTEAVVTEPVVVAPPHPISEAPRTLTLSPSVVVAALMTFGIILFGIYLAFQLLRFAKPPTLEVTRPATALVDADETATSYRLEGTSSPSATITITSPGRDQPYRVSALADGTWSVDVELRRGQNTFEISATDPETGKQAESSRTVVITVPFLVIQAPTLTVSQPVDGTTFENGAIPIEGTTTNASSVSVAATYLGPVEGQPQPSPTPTPDPSASPGPSGEPGPEPLQVDVAADGSFSAPLELTEGRWSIVITASSSEGKTASLTRTVAVAYKGVNLVVTIKGGPAWLKVWVDGALDPRTTAAGRTYRAGDVVVFTGTTSVEVRTGSSGSTYFTLNGVSLGALGKSGVPETWLFAPPAPPTKTGRT
jgi:cytoskeletal protein RodZ